MGALGYTRQKCSSSIMGVLAPTPSQSYIVDPLGGTGYGRLLA